MDNTVERIPNVFTTDDDDRKMVVLDDHLYFPAQSDPYETVRLWSYDGSSDPPSMISGPGEISEYYDPRSLTAYNGRVYFTATKENNIYGSSELEWYVYTPTAPDNGISVKGNNIEIVHGDEEPDPSDHTDFEEEDIRTFTIENTGTEELTVTKINIENDGEYGFFLLETD